MFELKTYKAAISGLLALLLSHQVLYAALAACHAAGAATSEKPLIYGTIAALYGLLALRG